MSWITLGYNWCNPSFRIASIISTTCLPVWSELHLCADSIRLSVFHFNWMHLLDWWYSWEMDFLCTCTVSHYSSVLLSESHVFIIYHCHHSSIPVKKELDSAYKYILQKTFTVRWTCDIVVEKCIAILHFIYHLYWGMEKWCVAESVLGIGFAGIFHLAAP